MCRSCTHFVGFRGEEYWSAVRLFGKPDFVHPKWDERARSMIDVNDTIVFAEGDEHQRVHFHNAQDYIEVEPKYEHVPTPRRNRKV